MLSHIEYDFNMPSGAKTVATYITVSGEKIITSYDYIYSAYLLCVIKWYADGDFLG